MAEVKLNNITKIFDGNVKAVDNSNYKIKDKEFMVLVGPSGCGKSTTLRMIAGLETITSGELSIGDTIVNDIAPKDRDIAMVFQNYALYPHMTVKENLAFGLKLHGFKKNEINSRVQEASEILDIADLLDRKPRQLSGGQQQRVAVGRAIVRHPKVFLFDEPLSNLDAKLRVQMRAEISKLHNKLKATMIYVTHDQTEAMTMGDRITVLNKGVVQQIDSPLNLYDHPINKFVASFIGSPAMNFINGKIVDDNGLFFLAENVKIEVPKKLNGKLKKFIDKSVTLGIRPERLFLTDEEADLIGTVEVVETLGNEIIVYLKLNNNKILVRLDTRIVPKYGDKIKVKLDSKYVHFFDDENGESITYSL